VTLPFDLFTSNLVYIITRQVGNLPTNFGVSMTFRSRLIGQHLPDASFDLATLTFDLGDHGTKHLSLMRVFVLRLCTKLEVRRPSLSEDIGHLLCQHKSAWWPWPLTFWPLNRFTEYSCDGLPLPILGFLGLSVVELSRGTGQTLDRRPDRQRRSIYNAPPLLGQGHNNITIKIRKYLK